VLLPRRTGDRHGHGLFGMNGHGGAQVVVSDQTVRGDRCAVQEQAARLAGGRRR